MCRVAICEMVSRLFLVASAASFPGHHSSSSEVQPALKSSVGSFREGALAETGVLGLCTALFALLVLTLGWTVGSASSEVPLALRVPLLSALVPGLAIVLKLLLRLKVLMMQHKRLTRLPRLFPTCRASCPIEYIV